MASHIENWGFSAALYDLNVLGSFFFFSAFLLPDFLVGLPLAYLTCAASGGVTWRIEAARGRWAAEIRSLAMEARHWLPGGMVWSSGVASRVEAHSGQAKRRFWWMRVAFEEIFWTPEFQGIDFFPYLIGQQG